MKKIYAILRTEKIKSWSSLTKSVGHNLRTSGDERSHLAKSHPEPIRVLAGDPGWAKEWREEVAGMWLPGLKQGDRHTLAREFFLGVSPEHFEGKGPEAINEWAAENVAWLRDRFGADRVKLAVLHLDEQTPHIAAYVVPLKADKNRAGLINDRGNGWTLSDSALGLGGNKSALVQLQDDYAERMARFSLERGERNSKAVHQTIRQWRKLMADPLPHVPFPKAKTASMVDRFDINGYGKDVAKAAALDVHRRMAPAWRQAKRLPALEKQVRQQAAIIERLQAAVDALKRALAAILGTAVDLDSLEGLKALHEAVVAFKQQKPKHEPAPPATIKLAPRAGRRGAAPDRRVGGP